MSIGILPSVKSIKLNRDAKRVTSVCSRTRRLKNKQVRIRKRALTLKNEKKSDDKGAVAFVEKSDHSWVVSRKTQSHQDFRKA